MLISMMSSPLAGYLDDWTDEALCGWMEQPSPPEYIVKEVKKRAIFCNNALPVDPKAASDKNLNALKNSGIKIYDIIFSDEIKEEELNIKIINLIEEHCERGFKEWSKWGEESPYGDSEYYPIFIKFLKQRFLKNLWESYQIRLTPFE